MPKISKKFALLLVLAMMATMFVGMGTASAATNNFALATPTVGVQLAPQNLGRIQIQESTPGAIVNGTQLIITLPAGTTWAAAPAAGQEASFIEVPPVTNGNPLLNAVPPPVHNITIAATGNSRSTLVLNFGALNPANTGVATFNIIFGDTPNLPPAVLPATGNCPLSQVTLTAGAADLKVNLLCTSGAITSGDVINAHVSVGGTTAYALAAPTRTQGDVNVGTIRIVENRAGALLAGPATLTGRPNAQAISLTLPRGIRWNAPAINVAGGFGGASVAFPVQNIDTDPAGNSRLWVDILLPSNGNAGVIDIMNPAAPATMLNISPLADKGDVIVTIGGNNQFITPATVVVAKYGEFGITASALSTPDLYAGRCAVDIGVPVVKENVPATLVAGRTLNLELPDGVSWDGWNLPVGNAPSVPIPIVTGGNIQFSANPLGGWGTIVPGTNGRTVSYTVLNVPAGAGTSTTASTIEFRSGKVNINVDTKPGDLNISFGGTAGAVKDDGSKVSVKVANIVTPIKLVGAEPAPLVIIGRQTQEGISFQVVEAGVGAIAATPFTANADIRILCPNGVAFTQIPEISVTGDLKLNLANASLNFAKTVLTIPVQSSSSATASTIEFKNVKYTLDRTVPEGDMSLAAGGTCVQWNIPQDAWRAANVALYQRLNPELLAAAEDVVAKVTTPAPGQENKVATFVVGQSKFTLEGVEVTMDVAPYIKDGRTFLPIAYVAQALGISDANIIWDAANQTVTLMKGDKVVQLKIGSTTMLVNGAAVTLDAAPEINNSRTCLPVALVAKALGEAVSWDAATQTITIQ